MIYIFSELDLVTEDMYGKWMDQLPKSRRETVERYKNQSSRLQSLCAFRLLTVALGFVPENFVFNEYNKPSLSDNTSHKMDFSITHSDNCVAVGVSRREIGVDVEVLRPFPQKVEKRVFTEWERIQLARAGNPDLFFFKLWTLKESYIKALGRGFSFPPLEVEFTISGEKSGERIKCSDERYHFITQTIGEMQLSACCGEPDDLSVQKLHVNFMDF